MEPISAADVKVQARIDADITAEDTWISTFLIPAARRQVEGDTRRTLIDTVYDQYFGGWRDCGFMLGRSPLRTLTAIGWTDADNVETLLDLADVITEPGRSYAVIHPVSAWPSGVLRDVAPIRIRYTAGYGAAATAVPADLRMACLLLCAGLYNFREHMLVAQSGAVIAAMIAAQNPSYQALIERYILHRA